MSNFVVVVVSNIFLPYLHLKEYIQYNVDISIHLVLVLFTDNGHM